MLMARFVLLLMGVGYAAAMAALFFFAASEMFQWEAGTNLMYVSIGVLAVCGVITGILWLFQTLMEKLSARKNSKAES